jgi:molybdate transport system substrate-binding protein
MKHLLFLAVLPLLFGCDKPSDKIIVAAAANVQYVMTDIKKAFEKETGKEIQVVISSSGKLTAQIREGAPFDVFVSADTKYPNEIYKAGGGAEVPKVYARGLLVLWSASIPAEKLSPALLDLPEVGKIAIPNPDLAPYGAAAMEVLDKLGLHKRVGAKIVLGESIAQTAQYITTGAAEVGFNALSIVKAPGMKGKGHWVKVDTLLYTPIAQAAILLNHSDDSPKKETSELFYHFLYSAKAKEIFDRYGYARPLLAD